MENRQFTVDASILFSIINAQAGTLPKAFLEAIMNAIDAGATRCSINLDATTFTVKDNGRGFQSRTEIENWFERFGTPHQSGDATYGRFRMGRGQMMAFARTFWRTGEFSMDVDVKGNGLSYGLKQGLREVVGCKITGTLYKSLQKWELNDTTRELAELARYAQIPIYLNKVLISRKPDTLKWDVESADAWIKLDSSSELKVYNLGVLVRSFGSYKYGVGGTIVTKVPLMVNFARNDILESQCHVWERISRAITRTACSKTVKKITLTDNEREFLARRMISHELDPDAVFQARTITTGVGSQVSLGSLLDTRTMALAPSKGDRLAERLHRSKTVFVVAPETLSRFGVESLEALRDLWIQHTPASWHARIPMVAEFAAIAQGYSKVYSLVESADATSDELQVLAQLEVCNVALSEWLAVTMKDMNETRFKMASTRKVLLGQSDAALAWTDGETRITFERRFLTKEAKKGLSGWYRILAVAVHEYCHLGEADLDGHSHPLEFFELFEALMTAANNPIAKLAAEATLYFSGVPKIGRRPKISASTTSATGSAPSTVSVPRAPVDEARTAFMAKQTGFQF